jgi:hypothetical protein
MEWSEETSHTGVGLSRLLISPGSRLSPAPGSPLDIFNSLVMRTPFILRFVGYKNNKTGAIKIEAGRSPISIDGFAAYLETGRIERKTDYTEEALWLIWEIYFREIGLERLKRCPQCQHWFVDRTRNKQKERCSQRCTWQWWSWSKRKEEGHNLPELKKTKPRKTKMGK